MRGTNRKPTAPSLAAIEAAVAVLVAQGAEVLRLADGRFVVVGALHRALVEARELVEAARLIE